MGGTHGVIPGRRARCSAEEVEAREQLLAQLLDIIIMTDHEIVP